MSKKFVIANWKMNPVSEKEAEKLFNSTSKYAVRLKNTEVIVCVPILYLCNLKKLAKKVKLGAQNAFYEANGAYTGEISVEMVYGAGARYVILGHSERRAMGETNEDVNKKIKSALSVGIIPILCVGEKDRNENHEYLNLVRTQVEECLRGLSKTHISKVIIAYEPVWAIGKNAIREATPEEFLEMRIFIKKIFSGMFGLKTKMPVVIYGGSVNEKNTASFIKDGEADGFLVGRASLDIEKFSKIVNICEASKI